MKEKVSSVSKSERDFDLLSLVSTSSGERMEQQSRGHVGACQAAAGSIKEFVIFVATAFIKELTTQ